MSYRFIFTLFFSLISPILVLADAIRSSGFAYKRWALTLFITIYGSTIIINPLQDGFRHQEYVYTYYLDMSFQEFASDVVRILSFKMTESGTQDVYKHVLSYVLGSVLGMPWLFFTVVAFVYGYFFSGALLIILRNARAQHRTYLFWGFVILFLSIKNIEGINTVRTWTGLWVLVYACLRYQETRKLKYVILMFMPPLIHVGYFVMAIPAYIFLVMGNRERLYAGLFVLSSFTNFLNPGEVKSEFEQTELGREKVPGYYVEEQANRTQIAERQSESGATWYRAFQKAGFQRWALNVLIYTIIFSGIYFHWMSYEQRSMFSIGLLTLALSNMTWFITALYNRGGLVGSIFILAAFLMAWQDNRGIVWKSNKPMVKVSIAVSFVMFAPFLVYNISALLDFPSVFLFTTPFLVWADESINMSIKDLLRFLIS